MEDPRDREITRLRGLYGVTSYALDLACQRGDLDRAELLHESMSDVLDTPGLIDDVLVIEKERAARAA